MWIQEVAGVHHTADRNPRNFISGQECRPVQNGFDTVYVPNTTGRMSSLATRMKRGRHHWRVCWGMTLAFRESAYLTKHLNRTQCLPTLEFYEEAKRALRKFNKMGVGALDIECEELRQEAARDLRG